MDWETLFEPQIIKRGWDYYQQDLVTNFRHRDGQITATVLGSKRYQVTLDVDGERLLAGNCTCPYAAGDHYCKHMAAVLFMADDVAASIPDETTVAGLLKRATDQQVRDFLAQMMQVDPGLMPRFAQQLGRDPHKPGTDLSDYQHQLDQIILKYTGGTYFVDYPQGDALTTAIGDFLAQTVRRLLAAKQVKLAVEVVNQVALNIAELVFDDGLEDETMWLVDACAHAWRRVLKSADYRVKKAAFDWFLADVLRLGVVTTDALTVMFDTFLEPDFLQEKVDWTAHQLTIVPQIRDRRERQRQRNRWVKLHLLAMQQLKLPPAKIERFCVGYLSTKQARLAYVALRLDQQDYTTAVRQLILGQQAASSWDKADFSDPLRQLYRQLARTATLELQRSLLVLSYSLGDTGFYQALKRQCAPEQWPQRRQYLLAGLPQDTDWLPLLAVDQSTTALLAGVLARPGLQAVRAYQRLLLPQFAPQLVEKYVQELHQAAQSAKSRTQYHQLVAWLTDLFKLPGGRPAANQVARDWRQRYHRRSAMMDELNVYF
ncbi:MAG: SWIM zinc finger family protein [Levilactobacillus sp.]|jgi:hypothetical protein|uniref:SWIM zinc finger family protein n=1 Tax=Levilactobacillus sp. TaxID=2767919 RepID=UPI00258EB719|nr:SWIM zinc finger family protein [Levilactobacillus sp.]MCI1553077.1 SWIM zinc finger family protein [Levilactobacillus sp.]MCI1598732.1 SWIM zinc finger family protein [Levilactobacillus sp.]MCI1605081.1 SWIM zinc finger family protein [Levilactobacillus sp.]